MRRAPSLEMSLVNMPMRDPAASEERRIIPHTRHTFFKSELSSSSVFQVERLLLHRTFPRHYFLSPQTAQKWEQRTGAPARAVSKQSARSFPTRRRVPEAPESQRSLEHQGSALLLRTTVTMFRLPDREKILECFSTHLHICKEEFTRLVNDHSQLHQLVGTISWGGHTGALVYPHPSIFQQASMYPHTSVSTWCTHTHQCIHKPQCIRTPQ